MSFEEDLGAHLEDEEIQKVLRTGTDLREYAKRIDAELKDAEQKSIADYLRESENIALLHSQIEDCDDILERMESMLLGFQSDLDSISSEIVTLQKKSVSMSVQLANRQALKGPLSSFIQDVAVSEALIIGIMDVPVTEREFGVQLMALEQKMSFAEAQRCKSADDVKDVLEKLKVKATAKIRAYLLEQVYKFRKPMTNFQVPQNAMLERKFFYEFVLNRERAVAREIRDEYVDTIAKVYFSYFKTYSTRLDKLRYEEAPTKDDLMGVEESGGKGFFHKASLKNKATVFTIGNRGDVLAQQLEAPIIVPHAQAKNKYPYEALFRSVQYALVDNGCREYSFVTELFRLKGDPAQDLFDRIMGKTLSMLIKTVESYVEECYDCIALFLCVQLILRYKDLCHERGVPALDGYWDALQLAIWPRLEFVFEANVRSVRECDPSKFATKEMGPHYVARRYAEFSSALVGLSERYPSEKLSSRLGALQEEVHCFLLKMAALFPLRVSQLVFLINNYDMALGVLMERTRDNSAEAESFRSRLQARSAEYAEEILSPHFGALVQFAKEGERALESGRADWPKAQERKSLALVASFSAEWKKRLELINREVLHSFPNLVTGSALLQLALTSLVQYYHRFHKLLTPNARTQLVNIHVIMVELKKYKTNY